MSTRARFHAFVLSAALALAFAPAFAQVEAQPPTPEIPPPAPGVPPGPPSVEPLKPVEPPAELPKPQAGDPKQNLDRLFRAPGPLQGHVVDFISAFGPNAEYFPIFNIADSSLFCGVVLAILLELTGRRRDGTRVRNVELSLADQFDGSAID